jgi:acetoin utilization deacetylase AcuC-like enzyme
MNIKINTDLSFAEKLLLPVYTPFAMRHLNKTNFLNKLIGAIELCPGISLMASLIELVAQRCFKERVVIVANKAVFMRHDTGWRHCESPQRVEAIEMALKEAHLMQPANTIMPRAASQAEVALCHASHYIQELRRQVTSLCDQRSIPFDKTHHQFPHIAADFQISPSTYETALYAAGAPLSAIDYILNPSYQTKRAFCIVRPPGHHAHRDSGSGFCVFNSVAIAAKYLAQRGHKVVIVDWDAHHGEGTQELVEKDPNIYYFSTHMDTANGFYPGPHWGHASDKGSYHNVLNCPVSGTQESCRKGILQAFDTLESAMDTFKPDFLLISCGFDAHENDSLVGLGLKDEDYMTMTKICIRIADKYAQGRIVSVLEGGYNLEAISGAAKVHVETLGS